MWEVLPTLLAPQVPPPAGVHGTLSIPIMLLQSSWAVLLLCTTAGFLGWLGLAVPPEKEELWEAWMRSPLNETPVAQLMQDIAHRMGNVSSRGAAEVQGGHQAVPSNLHQEQERRQDIHSQPESILVLQEVMEKLQKVNQSLEQMLTALEDAQSHLEKHLEHLKAIPDLGGQSQSVTSSCIPHSSYFTLLALPLVPASFQAIFLLLFLASSALGIPAISILLVLAAAGHWLLASGCRGARRIRPGVSWEKARYRLTSTPERECDMELLQEELDRMEMSCLQNERCPQEPSHLEQPQEVVGDIPKFTGQVSPDPDVQRTTRSSCGVTPEPVMDAGKLREPKLCSPRANISLCQGLTRAGQRCRKKAIPGLEFCHIHTTSSSLAMDSSPHF
ncbi:protein brambleberry-like [Agelaius tricolor]|uniref:protein brambleberry-like n=1 Tax=Agelaius tricolor TaxID=9191 RepID=UPI0039F20BF3